MNDDQGGVMAVDLVKVAKEKKIKYFLISFVDLFGVLRAKLVPAQAIGEMQKAGAGFAGFATWLDMTPANSDMFAVPDPGSLMQIPWNPEVGWLASDLIMDGKPVEQGPRLILKRQIERAAKLGYRMKTGVECEYFIISADGRAVGDARDVQPKPCYDQSALMRRYEVIKEICDSMLEGAYQNDHEDANGQFEMNWHYADCLTTADRHVFFKYMVKTIAEKHGLRATFMPKPFLNLTGSGCHCHVSVWDKSGVKNLFLDHKGELGLSQLAYRFLGGVLRSADALCAVFTPTINSFKRLNAASTLSGATWSPNAITYGGNNRTHMVRIPEAGRFELRIMDGAANPYLLQAGVLAAGLDGTANNRDPGKRLDVNMYTEEGQKLRGIRRLPPNLLDAIRLFEKSEMLREAFGEPFVASYAKLKTDEVRRFNASLTQWELDNTLDC